MNRAADAELFYKKHFKDYLEEKEQDWLKSLGEKDWTKEAIEHAVWHQGALACLKEIQEWFDKQVALSLSRFDKGDE